VLTATANGASVRAGDLATANNGVCVLTDLTAYKKSDLQTLTSGKLIAAAHLN